MERRSKTLTNYGMHFSSKKYPKSEPKRVQQALTNELKIDMLAQGGHRSVQGGPWESIGVSLESILRGLLRDLG